VISTPAAITSGLAVAARRGALIKGGAALEQLGQVRQVAFDKTGTLTVGQPQVTAVIATAEVDDNALLALAAAVEQGSSHPLAQAIVREAQRRQLSIPLASGQRRWRALALKPRSTAAASDLRGQQSRPGRA
jgi:Cd2+/Zn2+-exporting ATPase